MTLFAIGDIQGCATQFDRLLARIDFDAQRDHLWLVGDLVNRGPQSLSVLRRVAGLGKAVTSVLGNHDLHLLAAAAGGRQSAPSDTFQDVLAAEDRDQLIDWLRHRPLLHWDQDKHRVLVHAGLPPPWSVEEAAARAADVEALLRSPAWPEFVRNMYGNSPTAWSKRLDAAAARRYTINALTRMRFCDALGQLEFAHAGPPGSQPGGLMPWFDVPGRRASDVHVVFGHWAALGLLQRDDLTALDSGCVWGQSLTAVALDPPGPAVSVACQSAQPR